MNRAVLAACEEYVLACHYGALELTDQMERMALSMAGNPNGIPAAARAAIFAGLSGQDTEGIVLAGCRAYVETGKEPYREDIARGLVTHNACEGGSAVRRACLAAWESYAQTFLPSTRTAVVEAAKRLGVVHIGPNDTDWDWFTSWSPRNDNPNGEGPWEHWIALAVGILRHPLTGIVHPDAHEAAHSHIQSMQRYSEVIRSLTGEEIRSALRGAEEVTFYSS